MPNPIVIDTNAFQDRDFRYWLRTYYGRKILPVIAYTELAVYFIGRKNYSQARFDAMIRTLDVQVEWLRHKEAYLAAELAVEFGDFRRNAHDYLIAAYAYYSPWIVVTYNTDHFAFLGNRVKTPRQIRS